LSSNGFNNEVENNIQDEKGDIVKKKKEGIFKRWFGKKKKKKNTKDEDVIDENDSNTNSADNNNDKEVSKKTSSSHQQKKQKVTLKSKKIYALQSISHRYNKVKGIDSKAKQFVAYKNTLLVACNTGVYQITNNISSPILKDTYVNYIFRSKTDNNKFYFATNDGILNATFKNNNGLLKIN